MNIIAIAWLYHMRFRTFIDILRGHIHYNTERLKDCFKIALKDVVVVIGKDKNHIQKNMKNHQMWSI